MCVKDHEEDKRAEELLYYLKKAILEEDEEQAEEFEGKLQVYTHEWYHKGVVAVGGDGVAGGRV